jgi:hypothetical protein
MEAVRIENAIFECEVLDEGEDGGRRGFEDIYEGVEIICIHRHPREEVISATRQP